MILLHTAMPRKEQQKYLPRNPSLGIKKAAPLAERIIKTKGHWNNCTDMMYVASNTHVPFVFG